MEGIPDAADPEIYEVRKFVDSKFVELTSDEYFHVQMQYPVLHMKHAETQCFVREEVYGLLRKAAKELPDGYRFRVLDAWRPFALQHELYTAYSADIIREFKLESCSKEEQNAVIRKYVSDPVMDREIPPVHTTGGAIDLTIEDEGGNALEMGTGFDAFTDRTRTAYFEGGGDVSVRDNRRLLYHIMVGAGFTNLPSEWWHFDYGDRFWAFYKNKPAIFKGVFTKEEM
jgi:D-alanyl-D-alanine dipeptidase